MDKLFLIDAYALIYRAYFAFIKNPRINSKGMNTSPIMGFCNTLHEVLEKEKPDYIAVAFDPHGPTFRHEAYAPYKAQREKTPEDITASVPIIMDILKAMNIEIFMQAGFEADDVIGTLAKKAAQHSIQVFMLTPDKDYGQLVDDNIYMYKPRFGSGYDVLGPKEITAKYDIQHPEQVIDILALMGDSADNFPGCPGIGEVTAKKLISQFGSVEQLITHTDQIKGANKKKVEEHIEDIKISKFLATIKTDVPVELDLEKIKVKDPDEEKLQSIFAELEFKTLANKFLKQKEKTLKKGPVELDLFAEFSDNGAVASENSSFESVKTIRHDYHLIENQEDIIKLRDFLLTNQILSLDTETTSTNAIDAELVGLSFAVKEHEAFYVPVPENQDEAKKIVDLFRPLYENPKILKVGQNIKYDYMVLRRYGIELQGEMFDTMIAHYLIQPELRHNMDYMAETYLHYQTIHIDELIGPKGKNQKSMRELAPADVYVYAAEDADITLQLKKLLEQKIKEGGVEQLFYEVEMPLVKVLAEMELTGVRIDTLSLEETSRQLTGRMNELEQRIYDLAGETFNIASPKQVGDILFGKMKIVEKAKKTKTGQYVTNEEVLQALKGKHEIVEDILAHRGLKKLLGTYVDALPKLINPRTGHIHTSFNQTVTATGRLSSSDPNLQNIPVRGEDGKEIRKAFIPEEGCLFFSADYSQIELRVMAHLSQDERMVEAFREGYDIHAATAARIYHETMESVTRDQRTKAKRANFGIIYGITVFGLAERLGIERSEARQLMDGYFEMFPQVREYMERAKEEAREKGYVETFFHRRRFLPDIHSANATVRGFAERNAINAPIQGSAADIIKVAMVRIFNRFRREGIQSKMILQVHDELNFSVLPDEKDRVEQIVIEEMEKAYPLNVPLIADAGWGNNWLEAH